MFASLTDNEHLRPASAAAKLDAIESALAAIEFAPDGTILRANANFLELMGYQAHEVVGRHHRIFVDPVEMQSGNYEAFWASLLRGECRSAVFGRRAKDGHRIWIQGLYAPIRDRGLVVGIIKHAVDISDRIHEQHDMQGQIAAISRAQAVIVFGLDGTIQEANANFLAATGYALDEVQGQHHRMFMPPEAINSSYEAFWTRLRAGAFEAGEFRRIGKDGREIWLQATYSPIFDPEGQPAKIVKYATDVTERKHRDADTAGQIAAIARSQAVIHFALDGTIQAANANFLAAVGYRAEEVIGRHHRMFVEAEEAKGPEYDAFWVALAKGEFRTGMFRRVGRGGREVWLQATYNPILGPDGRPYKIVKYASDVTAATQARLEATLATRQTLKTVEGVATAAEEMNASADAIKSTVDCSKHMVDGISTDARTADLSTRQLRDTAQAMNGIVQTIMRVASQTNLLALNATIEAARAGPAGRGFSVVATEVKALAGQTNAATRQISEQIAEMQRVSETVAGSLTTISTAVMKVQGYVTDVAKAVDAQSAATRAISTNMQDAAGQVGNISASLDKLAHGF